MNLTPVEWRVRDACLSLLADGVYPAGEALAARVRSRGKTDLIRIRNRLVARGHLPAAAGRAAPPSQLRITEADRRAVAAACRDLADDGLNPSLDRLRMRLPDLSHKQLRRIRGELIEAGMVRLEPARGEGLHGRTEAELAEVKRRTEELREEKIARGEVARPVEIRVCRNRQFDRWFVGRR